MEICDIIISNTARPLETSEKSTGKYKHSNVSCK